MPLQHLRGTRNVPPSLGGRAYKTVPLVYYELVYACLPSFSWLACQATRRQLCRWWQSAGSESSWACRPEVYGSDWGSITVTVEDVLSSAGLDWTRLLAVGLVVGVVSLLRLVKRTMHNNNEKGGTRALRYFSPRIIIHLNFSFSWTHLVSIGVWTKREVTANPTTCAMVCALWSVPY